MRTQDAAAVSKQFYYNIELNHKVFTFFLSLVFAGLVTIVSMLSIGYSGIATSTKGVSSFFLSIVIILGSVYYLGWWGIVSALVGSFFFGLGLNYDALQSLLWSCANVIQAFFMVLLFKNKKVLNTVSEGKHFFPPYFKTALFCIIPLFFIILYYSTTITACVVSCTLVIILYFIYAVKKKNTVLLFLPLIFCLVSLTGACYGVSFSMKEDLFSPSWVSSVSIWVLTNTVLLSTLGSLMLCLVRFKRLLPEQNRKKKSITIRVESLLYLFSLIIWNFIFTVLYITNWFSYGFSLLYLFPWLLGFIFFSANALLSMQQELNVNEHTGEADIFAFLEQRAIVAEKNTGTIILVLSILIPVAGSMMNTLTKPLISVFIITISIACASIGLIWVPQSNLKLMSLIKTLKTVLHLFTICFLLLGAILLLNSIA